MSRDDDKEDKKKDRGRPNHTGSTVAEDDEFTRWLHRLWARNEPPERVELWQMFGRNRAVRGEMIHHEDFKPNEKLDIEQANKLANEIMEAAQNDCDSTPGGRAMSYELAVIDRNRKAQPLVRRIGPVRPKRSYALTKAGELDEEEPDDELDAKSLNLRYTKEGFEQLRWDKQRNDKVLGELIMLAFGQIERLQTQNDKYVDRITMLFDRNLEAEDRRAAREVMLEKEKFKLGLMKDGFRTARNLLPGLFGGTETGASNGASNGANGSAHQNGTNGGPKDFGPSRERTLVDNFLNDIEEEGEALCNTLFGEYEEQEGKIVWTKDGVFTPKQFAVLVGVRMGRLPPSALDPLLPKSGHEMSITEDQIKRASDAGVTEGMGIALLELIGLRRQSREAAHDVVDARDEDNK